MRDQSAFGEATRKWDLTDFEISDGDCFVLRDLAKQAAEAAARPEQKERAALWEKHNRLEATRPLVFCDPENGWNELIPDSVMRCQGELAAIWENRLRKDLFWANEMGDDKVTDNNFYVYYVYSDSGWGIPTHIVRSNEELGSYTWKPGLESYDMIDKLHFPEIIVDYESTEKIRQIAEYIFGGILNVELRGQWWWSINPTNDLVYMRGLEQFMMDFMDYGDELHRVMAFLRDGYLHKLDFLQKNNLLSRNDGNIYVGSGGFGFVNELPSSDFDGKVRLRDMWGFSESQETICISPEMFEEFVFAYQLPLMEPFGLCCYGCCEPMDMRIEIVKKARNLRRVSVSPWAQREKMRDAMGANYIYSYKPTPADIARPVSDWERIRKELRETLAIAKDCRLEIIMKDNHTLGNNPDNAKTWCRIAKEEAMRL
jgi:hypothetical protein